MDFTLSRSLRVVSHFIIDNVETTDGEEMEELLLL